MQRRSAPADHSHHKTGGIAASSANQFIAFQRIGEIRAHGMPGARPISRTSELISSIGIIEYIGEGLENRLS
jgi:hypothetical protein